MIQTFTGSNAFTLQQALQKLVLGALKSGGDFGLERLDASECSTDTIIQAVQSLPFLAPSKLVVVTNISANNQLMERIAELVDRTADELDVVLVDQKLDKRKTSYKTLQKRTKVRDFKELDARQLSPWVVSYATSQGATIAPVAASYLVERVGAHQQLLAREIEKLASYNSTISRESIELLCDRSIQSTIFSLLDAAFAGDSKRAIALYREQRQARIEPQYILAMLTWQLQSLAIAVFSEHKTEASLVGAGLSPFSAKKALSLSRHISRFDMKRFVAELSALDLQIKTSVDADAGLELFLLRL